MAEKERLSNESGAVKEDLLNYISRMCEIIAQKESFLRRFELFISPKELRGNEELQKQWNVREQQIRRLRRAGEKALAKLAVISNEADAEHLLEELERIDPKIAEEVRTIREKKNPKEAQLLQQLSSVLSTHPKEAIAWLAHHKDKYLPKLEALGDKAFSEEIKALLERITALKEEKFYLITYLTDLSRWQLYNNKLISSGRAKERYEFFSGLVYLYLRGGTRQDEFVREFVSNPHYKGLVFDFKDRELYKACRKVPELVQLRSFQRQLLYFERLIQLVSSYQQEKDWHTFINGFWKRIDEHIARVEGFGNRQVAELLRKSKPTRENPEKWLRLLKAIYSRLKHQELSGELIVAVKNRLEGIFKERLEGIEKDMLESVKDLGEKVNSKTAELSSEFSKSLKRIRKRLDDMQAKLERNYWPVLRDRFSRESRPVAELSEKISAAVAEYFNAMELERALNVSRQLDYARWANLRAANSEFSRLKSAKGPVADAVLTRLMAHISGAIKSDEQDKKLTELVIFGTKKELEILQGLAHSIAEYYPRLNYVYGIAVEMLKSEFGMSVEEFMKRTHGKENTSSAAQVSQITPQTRPSQQPLKKAA